jgi:hypothetical protein
MKPKPTIRRRGIVCQDGMFQRAKGSNSIAGFILFLLDIGTGSSGEYEAEGREVTSAAGLMVYAHGVAAPLIGHPASA